MGKISWSNTSASDIDDYEPDGDFGGYDGETPPPSIYRFRISNIKYDTFKSGNTGLTIQLDLDDPRKEKEPYKGYRTWERVVDTEGSVFKIKQFLDAIGASGKDWANTQTDSENAVTKIGRIKVAGNSALYVRAQTKMEPYQGENQCRISRFLKKAEESDDDSGSGSDGGEQAPF